MEHSPLDFKVLWLAMNVSSNEFFRLTEYYGDVEGIWDEFDPQDGKIAFISNEKRAILAKTKDLGYVNSCMEKWHNPDFITLFNGSYPRLLAEITDPPLVLFHKGDLQNLYRFIGVVGTRKCTEYGLACAQEIAMELAAAGVTIVSGGARGIDSSAHIGAMDAGGTTVCVLGCGIDVVYPPENDELFDKIVKNGGAIISEFMPGEPPHTWNFPKRNRIISGMSKGVLVIEAAKKSGALITAQSAVDENRDVFSLPGNINSEVSIGTNDLIKNGAILVSSAQDILNEYQWAAGTPKTEKTKKTIDNFENLDDTEKTVVKIIAENGKIAVDELCVKAEMSIGQINSVITMLEIGGSIKRLPGNILTI